MTQPRTSPPRLADAPPRRGLLPLAVDLDGTLLLTDTLFEAVADRLRNRPFWTLLQLVLMPFSIAKVKARLQRGADIDTHMLPVNESVLAYCREARTEGREIVLVSAADQSVVTSLAARFGVFDRAIGSDGVTNNKGEAKANILRTAFPDGFEYIGDSPADLKVWRAARVASHVDGGDRRRRAIERMGVAVGRSFERPHAGLGAWRKAFRLHQWAKNLLIFVAPVLAMKATDAASMTACLIALPMLGILASGTYILNDLLDLNADRRHHSKQMRPFASGRIKLWHGFVAAPLMIGAGLAGGAMLSIPFALTMAAYLAVTLSYSLVLKRAPLVDVMLLGLLFTLRLLMGGVLTDTPLTQWLIVFSMFLFVSLSLAKRHVEVIRKAAVGERVVANRGYTAEDAPLTLGLGLATATACPVILVLYLIDSAWAANAYAFPGAVWTGPVVLSLWLMRVWLLANRAQLDDDPVTFAIRDPLSLALGAVLAASFALAAFGLPDVVTRAFSAVFSGQTQ
ncbi:MAG: UbiA family prenyltransferase [Alphaproteobacteria bacterium]|nr:UbiA family prenyltransferase [Alphaproteobacteria bacterium]